MLASVLPWYLNLLFLGWLAWPLLFRVCTRLHDRGYGLARAFGLILTAYLTWLLGNTALARGASPLLPFGYTSVLLAAGAVALVSLVSFLTEYEAILAFLRRNRRTVLCYEALSLAAFALMVALRAQVPHISYFSTDYAADPLQDYAAEKFTDFAILNGLLASAHFPPQDPWLAGATMNYYYFGHLLWACMIKLTGVRPEIGYNLALASILALVAVQACSLGYNLTRRLRWGLLAAFLIAAAGNLDGFLQLLGIAKLILIESGRDGLPVISGWEAWFRNYDFWRSSRAVENTITEFPAFSFVLGDLHAHLSGLVIFLAGLGLLIQMFRSARFHASLLRYEIGCWDELFLAALLMGAMSAANSWDALTFAGVTACVLWAARLRRRPAPGTASGDAEADDVAQRLLAAGEVLILVAVLVLLGVRGFFFAYGRFFEPPFPPLMFSLQGGGLSLAKLEARGGWSLEAGLRYLAPSLEIYSAPLRWLRPTARTSVAEFFAHWVLLLAAPALLGGALVRRAYRKLPAGQPRQKFWALAAIGVAVAFVMFPVLQGWVACLGIAAVLALMAVLAGAWQPPALRFLLALLLAFVSLALFCELLYIDDIFDVPIERINTVFKVYYGMWPLAVLMTVLAARRLIRYAPPARRRKRALALVLPMLLVGGTYTVMAPVQRVLAATRLGVPDTAHEDLPAEALPPHMRPEARPATLDEALDGLRYLRFIHPDDYLALRWMRDRKNVSPQARILEAAAGQYEYAGRFSTITGRPALAGWLMHEYGWRGPRFVPERERRTTTTQEIYTTRNPFKALALLKAEGIDYVVVGNAERRKYPTLAPDSMAEMKFRIIGEPVFESGATTIYRIRRDDSVPPPRPGEMEEPPEESDETARTTATEADGTSTTAPEDAAAPPPPEVKTADPLTTDSLIEVLTRIEGRTTASSAGTTTPL